MASTAPAPEYQAVTFYARPGKGTSGKPTTVKTNFFAMNCKDNGYWHHYDVSITPEKLPGKLARTIFYAAVDNHSEMFNGMRPVYDGRANAFTPKELPFRAETFNVVLPEEDGRVNPKRPPREFKLKFRWAAKINMEEQRQYVNSKAQISGGILTANQATDIVLRNEPSLRFTCAGRSFYTPVDSRPLGGGAEVWPGIFLSARPGPGRMLLNCDVSATAFHKQGSLIVYVSEILKCRGLNDLKAGIAPRDLSRVSKALKNIRIRVTHRGDKKPKFKIEKLAKEPANREMFEDRDGKSHNVAQYFQKTYNMRLEYPNL